MNVSVFQKFRCTAVLEKKAAWAQCMGSRVQGIFQFWRKLYILRLE